MNVSNNKYPLVSVISVNYNYPEVTGEMVESLRHISYPNIEIIIIDNGSIKGNVDLLKVQFPEIILLKSDKNLGFAGGNNLGIISSKGKYILLLNNDTIVEPNFLEPLVNKCEENKNVGAVSPKLYYYHDKQLIQWTGNYEMNKITMRCFSRGTGEKEKGIFNTDWKSSYNHGAAMLVPRAVIEQVGLMAEIYFLYYEELDWGEQIKNNGFDIYFVHNSIVFHKESVSIGAHSRQKIFYLNRGRLIFLRRNVHGLTFLLAIAYMIFISVPKNLFWFLMKMEWSYAAAYMSSILWNLKNIFNAQIHTKKQLSDYDSKSFSPLKRD
jgi:GT2 family glycosyltransferase